MVADRWNDPKSRALPLAWRRKCNNKLYGLHAVRFWPDGVVAVTLRQSGTNNGIEIPLTTLARCFRAEKGYVAIVGPCTKYTVRTPPPGSIAMN